MTRWPEKLSIYLIMEFVKEQLKLHKLFFKKFGSLLVFGIGFLPSRLCPVDCCCTALSCLKLLGFIEVLLSGDLSKAHGGLPKSSPQRIARKGRHLAQSACYSYQTRPQSSLDLLNKRQLKNNFATNYCTYKKSTMA